MMLRGGTGATSGSLFGDMLWMAATLRVLEMEQHGGPTEAQWERARSEETIQMIASEPIMYRVGKPGATAARFNRIAEAVAVLAFCDGGIDFCGMHFEGRKEKNDA